MGRSYTPTYRVEVKANVNMTDLTWDTKRDGRANAENLEALRKMYNASFQPGGVNFHADGIVPHISKLVLIRQRDGKVIAEANAPMFEVV